MKLSAHFSLDELTRSPTAARLGLDNRPGPSETIALKELCLNVLQPLRDKFGPLVVTSGYRSPEVNRLIPGGSPTSQHALGQAADIRPLGPGVGLSDVALYAARRLPIDQVILEYPPGGWVHVSYGPRHPRQVLIKLPGRPYRRVTPDELRQDYGASV
ncbi:MAG: peptidase M15 [Proteobacteria bacterium]|nr:peptidase M15 [Pseudomonadota bacterium]